MLEDATRWARHWVLSGAIVGWGDASITTFDPVVFLYAPAEVGLARLRAREQERFGPEIEPGGSLYGQHRLFFNRRLDMTPGPTGEHLRPTPTGWHRSIVLLCHNRRIFTDDQVDHILSL